jgi:hypothetical protein
MSCIAPVLGLAAQGYAAADELKTQENRAVTVEDAIEMTRLADPGYLGGGGSAGRVAIFSPDKSRFAVVLRKGHNSNEYSLILWQTRGYLARPSTKSS